jgi:hypothetical protein
MKFAGLDALRAQIAADTGEARARLAAYAGPAPGRLEPLADSR